MKQRDRSAKDAKTELERYGHYMHRWEAHKKAADVARNDLKNLFDLEKYYVDAFGVRVNDAEFLKTTLATLDQGRSMLSNAYVREFYSVDKRISAVEKNMWSHCLSELEIHTDRLQEYYEKGQLLEAGKVQDFTDWKQEVINLTRVARRYFDGFVEGALKGTLVSQSGAAEGEEGEGEALTEAERFYSVQLSLLASMGFTDRPRMIELLEANGGDAERVVEKLIS
jgi:hypothetical protein